MPNPSVEVGCRGSTCSSLATTVVIASSGSGLRTCAADLVHQAAHELAVRVWREVDVEAAVDEKGDVFGWRSAI